MQKTLLALWVSAISLISASCTKEETRTLNPNQVKLHNVASDFTGSTYPVYVILPPDYDASLRYSTLYALDGDDLTPDNQKVYDLVGITCQEKSASTGRQNIIAVCIGALGQEERFRDYSPVPFMTKQAPSSGGSEQYARFIEQELIPLIEHEYNVDTTSHSRIICGHSLGGTFTGFMFARHPHVFENYITLSPAFYWGDGAVMEYEETARDSLSLLKRLVFVGCGEYEEGIRIFAREWHHRMQTFYPDCKTDYNEVNGTGHVGSAVENIRSGIEFYFKNQ